MVTQVRRFWARERPLLVVVLLVLAGTTAGLWRAASAPPPPAEASAGLAGTCHYDAEADEMVVPVRVDARATEPSRLQVTAGAATDDGTPTGYAASRTLEIDGAPGDDAVAATLQVRVTLPQPVWERGGRDCWVRVA